MLSTFFKKEKIEAVTNASMAQVEDGRVVLADDRKIEFDYAMIVPPAVGQDAVSLCTDISNDDGFVNVRDTYQTVPYDNVYAVGVAAAVELPWQSPTPVGVPTIGLPTELQARCAARNIAAQIKGERPTQRTRFGDSPAMWARAGPPLPLSAKNSSIGTTSSTTRPTPT